MRKHIVAAACGLALVAAACGQKPGVHSRGSSTETTTTFTGTTTAPTDTGITTTPTDTGAVTTPTDLGTTTTTTPTDTGAVTTPTTTTGGKTGGTKGKGKPGKGGGGGTGPAQKGSVPGVSIGVTDTTITYGLHAPVTGAAPIRSDSFNTGKDLYWSKGGLGGTPVKVAGKWSVIVKFADDQYNPSTAKSVCQKMAELDAAHFEVGGGGTDQIKACADYARTKGIPYFSAGVVHDALAKHTNYFAVSMSYKQQAPLLAQYIKNVLKVTTASKVAMIATSTSNFNDAVTAFQGAFDGVAVIRPSKTARGSTYADDICQGPTAKYDVVFPLTSPTFFLELEGSAACPVKYAGIGITMGLDTVAKLGCQTPAGSMHGATFFSPFPAYAQAVQNDATFKAAAAAGGTDDITYALWGISKVLQELLERAAESNGGLLTRQALIQSTATATDVSTGIFPTLNYTPTNHFGANQVYVLKAVCQGDTGAYTTDSGLTSSF